MKATSAKFGVRRAVSLNAINVLALILGFSQQVAVVRSHGAGFVTDFYFLLIIVPQVLINLANSIVNNALQPFLLRRRDEFGADKENLLLAIFANRLWQLAGIAALLTIGIGAVQGIRAPAWSTARMDVLMMLGCAPFLVMFGVINALYTTALQSRRDYWPGFVGLMLSPSVGIAVGLVFFRFGVWPFVAGQSAGMVLQYLWLKGRVRSPSITRISETIGFSARERLELRSKFVALFLVGIGFQFLPFIERSVAQKGETGSVAAIALATRLGASVSPIIVSATASMLFTTFAELAAAGNSREAVSRLMQVLTWLQMALTGLIIAGPLALAKALPLFLPQPVVAQQILQVFPDYLFAGCVSAAGSLSIGCYYSVFPQFRFQLYSIYGSLLIYGAILAAPLWTQIPFSLHLISLADAIYFILSVVSVTLYVAVTAGRIFPWRYLLSLAALTGAWWIVRQRY